MKTRLLIPLLILALAFPFNPAKSQTISLSPELKGLIELSLQKDYKISSGKLDKQITEEQRKAVRSAYLPKVEFGGKYVYALSSVDSKIDQIQGFESLAQIQELMQSPAFPLLFPNLAQLSAELTQLQALLAQQGIQLPKVSQDLDGNFRGNYVGLDATTKILLYSGGQVPNASKALEQKAKAQEALIDKSSSEVISDLITYYDQLALLNQSAKVLDESGKRLAAEKKLAETALKNGMATSFDTLKIAVAEANLQAKQSELQSKKTLLYQKLAQMTGKESSSFSSMNPTLELLLYMNPTADINNRAEMKALDASLEAQKYLLKSEKSAYLPKVQAMASVRYDNLFKADADMNAPVAMDMKFDRISLGPTVMAGVGFRWELFDRSNGSSRIKKAGLEVKKAENAKQEAEELLRLNLQRTNTTYQSAIAQLAYKEKQRQAAAMALDLATKSYNEGMITITERLAAETELQNAEFEYLQAIYAQRQSALDCYKATGDLNLTSIR